MTASAAVSNRPKVKQRPGDRVFAGATRVASYVILVALAGVAVFLTVEGLPALGALMLLGRWDAVWSMPPEFQSAAAGARAWGPVEPEPILLGLLLGSGVSALVSWRQLRRRGRIGYLGRPPRLPQHPRELPTAALLALSAGAAEELYFRLALPLLVTIVSGSAVAGFVLGSFFVGMPAWRTGPPMPHSFP